MMKQSFLVIALAALVACYFFVGWVIYMLFWPTPTLVFSNYSNGKPIAVMNGKVHPGDRLSYLLDYCKYADIPSTVHRTLIDGQIITLTDTQGSLPLGCHQLVANTAVIPETINPGRYYLDVSVIYQVNVLRSQVTHYRTAYFDVTRGEPTTASTTPLTPLK